ncbi:MAG: hypothetical protein IT182_04035 [Acidobacteria bacterium]|nr:hypothetical protein [Acidobacteriota bacterium]
MSDSRLHTPPSHHAPRTPPADWSWRGVVRLVAILAVAAAIPLLWRPAMVWLSTRAVQPSYLPALEASRERIPFRPGAIDDLQRLHPSYVFIGDSMLGTRIDAGYLAGLVGQDVAMLARAGTGSAYWYLSFKNYLVASGERPKVTFFFFRDLNMTDPLFRLTGPFRWSLDEVAHETEPALNDAIAARVQGPWYRVHDTINRVYDVERANAWVERQLYDWPTRLWTPDEPARRQFLDTMNFEIMGLERLRPMAAADLQAAEDAEADFGRTMPSSVLPLIVDLAKQHGLHVCFVRVQRRPVGNRAPEQSPRMQAYMRDFRAYVEQQGMSFHDDTGDQMQTLAMYEDGDHIARAHRQRYTRQFRVNLNRLFR